MWIFIPMCDMPKKIKARYLPSLMSTSILLSNRQTCSSSLVSHRICRWRRDFNGRHLNKIPALKFDEQKPLKLRVTATSNRGTTKTKLNHRNHHFNSRSVPNKSKCQEIRKKSSGVFQRLHSTKSLTRFEKHALLQQNDDKKQKTRAEIYAINKILRDEFEEGFNVIMERKRLEKIRES